MAFNTQAQADAEKLLFQNKYTALPSENSDDNTQYFKNQYGEQYYYDPDGNRYIRSETNEGDQQYTAGSKEYLASLYSKHGLDPAMMRGGEEMSRPTEINGGLYVPVRSGYFDPNAGYDNFSPAIKAARAAALKNVYIDSEGNTFAKPQDVEKTNKMIAPYLPPKYDFFNKYGVGLVSSAVLGPAIAGAAGGAGVGAAASADAIGLAQMGQAAGLSGSALAEFIASGGTLGSTAAGAGGITSGFTASPYDFGPDFTSNVNDLTSSNWYDSMTPQDLGQAVNPWTTNPSFADLGGTAGTAAGSLSVFDRFLNGILNDPVRAAMSAGQILSGISTANRAMSPQQAQAMADPFSPYRQQYINQLNAVMANPALAMSQPGYQFQRQQGEQAIDRKLAARGMGSYTPDGRGSASGGADIARMKYGQEYALGSYNDYVKQLSGLAGATQAPGVGGQAALSAQAAAARAATEGWTAINQGVGTMQGIMKAAPSGNPNNSGWSTPATPGFNATTDTGNYWGSSFGEPTFPVQPDFGWGYT